MEDHQFIDATDSFHNIHYNLVFGVETYDVTCTCFVWFYCQGGYKVLPEDIIACRNNQAAAEEEPQDWDAQVPPPDNYYMDPDGYYRWWLPS